MQQQAAVRARANFDSKVQQFKVSDFSNLSDECKSLKQKISKDHKQFTRDMEKVNKLNDEKVDMVVKIMQKLTHSSVELLRQILLLAPAVSLQDIAHMFCFKMKQTEQATEPPSNAEEREENPIPEDPQTNEETKQVEQSV